MLSTPPIAPSLIDAGCDLEEFCLPDACSPPSQRARLVAPCGLAQWRVELADGAVVNFPGVAESLLLQLEQVAWEMSGARCRGNLLLTDFRIVLQPSGSPVVGLHDAALPLEIPLGAVVDCKAERSAARLCDSSGAYTVDQVLLRCLDFRCVRVITTRRPEKGTTASLDSLMSVLQARLLRPPAAEQPSLPSRLFVASMGQPTARWAVLDWESEFQRQGVSAKRWRPCHINAHFGVCDSYPPVWWVPLLASDDDVQLAFARRARRRGPLLTWHHRGNGSVLLRCAQPVGAADSQYLEHARRAVHEDARLVFFDCRSRLGADMNYVTQGGGVEDPRKYMHSHSVTTGLTGALEKPLLLSFEIPNLHRVRESFNALRDLIEGCPSDSMWLASLAKTGWLESIRQLLVAALTVARLLHDCDRRLVLVHCSDGWDRTAQVCSLAQVLLDPFYRTAEGLAVLVEKDWVAFGHQFEDRQFGASTGHGDAQSPIFLQWLFCLAAAVHSAPLRFEYTSEDLGLLADMWLSGWSGSLCRNGERARRESGAEAAEASLWALWLSSRERAGRTDYRSWHAAPVKLLLPAASLKQLTLWPWCLRFDESVVSKQLSLSGTLREQSDVVWWLRDDAAPECFFCRREFALNRRRHHCRLCGQLFCSACCKAATGRLSGAGRLCGSCLSRHSNDAHAKADEDLELWMWRSRPSSSLREPSPDTSESPRS